ALEQVRRLVSPRCPSGAPTCSYLRSAPVSTSPCPGTADGAVGLPHWLLPCLPSHEGFQLHRGRHHRPPWRFTPICLGAPASDWRLGTSQGCTSALDAPTQGLASLLMVTAPP